MKIKILSAILFLFCVSSLFAQDPRGTLAGRVTDSSDAAIPGVEVRATNAATGVSASARTNESGIYSIPYLLPGTYRVNSEIDGFKKYVRNGIEIRVNDTVDLGIRLEVGAVTESVEVKAETPLLETANASLGQVVDSQRIQDLPVQGGSPVELIFLSPGITSNRSMMAMKASFNATAISSEGSPTFTNEFQIDGVSNTFADGSGKARDAFRPPAASVGEFRVQPTPYDASAGHTMGAFVTVSSASGTNQIHGEAHYWASNSAFDAPGFFNNKNSTKVPAYKDHRYGASMGGPIFLPRIYDGRNRSFFHYAYEGNKWGNPLTFTGTVPTAAERQGDFSAILGLGAQYQIYDPLTTRTAANGRFQRDPIPGNRLPANRLDKVGQNLIDLWPLPNQAGTIDGRNNWYRAFNAIQDYNVHVVRVDHAFSESNRVFLRVHKDAWMNTKIDYYPNGLNRLVLGRSNKGVALDNVQVISPTMVLNLRYGITYQDFPEYRITRGYDLSKLGFSQQLTSLVDPSLATIPRFSAGAFSAFGNWETGDGTNSGLTHTLAATVSKAHNKHNIRMGADFRVYRAFESRYPYSTAPSLDFANKYTVGPFDNSTGAPVGQELAAMLLGVPAGRMDVSTSAAVQDKYLGLYIHDDFRLSNRLTLNIGLRYEYEWPLTERFDRLVAGFAFGESSPIEAAARANYARNPLPELPASQFFVRGGQTFLNERGIGRSPMSAEKNNFMPRIGFAYQLRPKTVVRGGYGIFYDSLGVNSTLSIQSGFSQTTPVQASLNNGLTYVASNANPFPTGLLQPAGAKGGLLTNLGQDLPFYNYGQTHGYSQRWSIGLQQLLPQSFALTADYVGSRGTRIGIVRQLNTVPSQYLSKLPSRDQPVINSLTQQFANPFSGLDPIFGANMSRANLLRPYPQFGDVSVEDPIGYSWYHSLQMQLQKRMSRGVSFQMSYTWSKVMEATEFLNPTDAAPVESIGGFDRPHRIVASAVWELPFGRGRSFGSNWPKVVNGALGGWRLAPLISFQSGPALGFGNIIFNGDIKNIALPSGERNVDRWFNVDAGFNKVTAQQLGNNIRTFPLRFSGIRADGVSRWDFSLIKEFSLIERLKLEIRAEAYNSLNHTSFNAPNMVPTNSAFGRVTAANGNGRSWQFAAKLRF